MSLTNPFGDFEITEAQALRALAHPVRLALLEHLQRHGPATATRLAPHVGATPSVVSWHLRHLASFGLVTGADGAGNRRERWWRAAATGYRFAVPADAEGRDAARSVRAAMFARAGAAAQQWLTDEEPRLDAAFDAVAGVSNTSILATADELSRLQEAIEELLAPYVRRKGAPPPPGTRRVRLLRHVLPEPEPEAP